MVPAVALTLACFGVLIPPLLPPHLPPQIFLTLRLDKYITWSFASVGSPLLVWMGLVLLGHLYEVRNERCLAYVSLGRGVVGVDDVDLC